MAYEFRCADAGASSCRWRTSADDQEELLQKVGDHLRKKHKVTGPPMAATKRAASWKHLSGASPPSVELRLSLTQRCRLASRAAARLHGVVEP